VVWKARKECDGIESFTVALLGVGSTPQVAMQLVLWDGVARMGGEAAVERVTLSVANLLAASRPESGRERARFVTIDGIMKATENALMSHAEHERTRFMRKLARGRAVFGMNELRFGSAVEEEGGGLFVSMPTPAFEEFESMWVAEAGGRSGRSGEVRLELGGRRRVIDTVDLSLARISEVCMKAPSLSFVTPKKGVVGKYGDALSIVQNFDVNVNAEAIVLGLYSADALVARVLFFSSLGVSRVLIAAANGDLVMQVFARACVPAFAFRKTATVQKSAEQQVCMCRIST
jgi:hypothetical protein